MLLHRCMFCLCANAAELKFDKNGGVYVSCKFCRTRSFCKSLDALRGVAIAPQLLESALVQRAEGKAPWVDLKIQEMLSYVQERTAAAGRDDFAPGLPEMVPFTEKKEQIG